MSFIEFTGKARLDKRTKRLVHRLGPDDIAIIDQEDIDRVSAEELLESGVRVVFNVAPSATGRYPAVGPIELVRGGVRLIDVPGGELFEEGREGEELVVRGSSLFRNGTRLVAGHSVTEDELDQLLTEQRGRVSEALEDFADNTLRFLREESKLLSEGVQLPQLKTTFRDRHALVVARDPGYKRDLRTIRPYIRDFKPVPVGGGARTRAARPHGVAFHHRPESRHQRGHRDPARAREGRRAHRRRRHALQPDRVPRAQPRGHVLDLSHPPQGGGEARRRARRLAAL